MDIETKAILRLQEAAQMSQQIYEKPLMIAYSGGKDSDVLLHLAIKAKIPMEVVHSHTTVDMPETVRHVRDVFHRLENQGISCTVQMPTYKGKSVTMWTLIPLRGMPPTRIARYCCSVLKENTGKNRFIATGVRWNESARRKKTRGIYEKNNKVPSRRIILTNDNDDTRRLFENCTLKAKRTVNPIIDWSDRELWDYIHAEQIDICKLYDCGFHRLGCIGCPLSGKRNRLRVFEEYPTYKRAYIRAFDKMLDVLKAKGLQAGWKTGEEVFEWWISK